MLMVLRWRSAPWCPGAPIEAGQMRPAQMRPAKMRPAK